MSVSVFRKTLFAGFLLSSYVLLGCSTMISDDYVMVPVTTEPRGAHVQHEGVTYTTPVRIPVKRGSDNVTLTLKKDGYEAVDFTLKKRISESVAGNILFLYGAPVGVLTDLASKRGYTVHPDELTVVLSQSADKKEISTLPESAPERLLTNGEISISPLADAVKKGDIDKVNYIAANKSLLSQVDPASGRTPLSLAVEAGRLDIAELLLNAGTSPVVHDFSGETALIHAVKLNNADAVSLMLKYKPDLSVSDTNKDTPLHHAAMLKGSAILLQLVRAGAPLEHKNAQGETALFSAAAKGNSGAVDILIRSGADHSVVTALGRTPLSIAAERGHDAVAALLVQKRAALDIPDKTGRTPLMQAVRTKHNAIAVILLIAGVNLNAQDDRGETSLMYAVNNDDTGMVEAMMKLKPDLTIKNRSGLTALDIAAQKGNPAVLSLLKGG